MTTTQLSSISRLQFSTMTLVTITALTALGLVFVPLACRLSLELVCLTACFLCMVTSVTDQLLHCKGSLARTMLSGALAIAAAGMVFHVTQGKVFPFPALGLALAAMTAAYPPKFVPIKQLQMAWSTVGLIAFLSIVVYQFYQTHSQRYFVNRSVASRLESVDPMRDGTVHYQMRSYVRAWHGPTSEIQTLFDALDLEPLYLPVTKCRLLFGCDKIEGLSFSHAMSPLDWKNLRRHPQLQYLDFTRIEFVEKNLASMPKADSLYQLTFFNCELPSGLLLRCTGSKDLTILQLVDCKLPDVRGLSSLEQLREVNLQKTHLSPADLDQIATLKFLTQLDLTDTELSNEDLIELAYRLSVRLPSRRGQCGLGIDSRPDCREGLAALIRCGAINHVSIAGPLALSDLGWLQAVDRNVSVGNVTR